MDTNTGQDRSTEDTPTQLRHDRVGGVVAWLFPIVVVLATLLAFVPSLSNGFVNWDDVINFHENPHYRGLGIENIKWMFTTFRAGPYQPLSWLTLGADYVLWGMDARGYHLTSVLIHAAATLAFYFLALRLFGLIAGATADRHETSLRIAAAVAALLFGIHPLRVESVAWATERRDVVSGVFFVLTILAYLRAQQARGDSRVYRKWLALSLLAYTASLLGKGMGITLPLVLLILDAYPLRRLGGGQGKWLGRDVRPVWIEKAPFIALAVIAGAVGVFGQIKSGAVAGVDLYPWERRIGVAVFATAFYLYKTILPIGLSPLYPMERHFDLLSSPYLISGGALLALTLAMVRTRRRWPAGLALWLAYIGMLAPVCGLTQMGPQVAADRYTYLPCLGWALLGGWLVWWLGRNAPLGVIVRIASGLVVAALGVLTWHQCGIWHDSVSLWQHAASVYPESHLIQRNWGGGLSAIGNHSEALTRYRQAALLVPESPEAHNNIGLALLQLGLPGKAEPPLRQALELKPTHAPAHYNLANVLVQLGRLKQAIEHYRLALEHRPSLTGSRVNLANTLNRLGKTDEAEREWRRAIKESPATASAYGNLATALSKQHRYKDAVEVLSAGVRNCPSERRLELSLTWLLVAAPRDNVRDGARAVRHAEKLARASAHQDPTALDLLAAAYAEASRFDEAVKHATRAADLAEISGKRGLARQIQNHLKLYRQKRPFRLRR